MTTFCDYGSDFIALLDVTKSNILAFYASVTTNFDLIATLKNYMIYGRYYFLV